MKKSDQSMFGKRFNILSFAGIKIGMDISWFFIAILLTWTLAALHFPFQVPGLSQATYWIMGAVGMLGLFICIVLHELGHAIVAKHYKIRVSQITLFIFGGVAEIKEEPSSPKVELLMAIAGPIVSVLLSFFMYGLSVAGVQLGWPAPVVGVTTYLALINAIIVVFNLIPAFPLDGGRIFRALLWAWKKNFGWATKVSTRIGSAFGFFLIILGIFSLISGYFISGFWLIILGLFLQRAAGSSRTQFYVGRELRSEKVSKFMKKDPICVTPNMTVQEFVDQYVYESHHHLYPVTEGEKLLGYISLNEVKSLLPEEWGKTLVKKVMVPRSNIQTVAPTTNALEALNLMQETGSYTLLVVQDAQLVGILTAQDLFKLISLKLELESTK